MWKTKEAVVAWMGAREGGGECVNRETLKEGNLKCGKASGIDDSSTTETRR